MNVCLNARPGAITARRNFFSLAFEDKREPVLFDTVLVLTGRRPRTAHLGLATVSVALDARGAIVANARLQGSVPSIYAVGDVTGLALFTHVAAHHARVATPNALFHTHRRVSTLVPRVTFTDPEVAHVGMTVSEAREQWGKRTQLAQSDCAAPCASSVHQCLPCCGCPTGADRRWHPVTVSFGR